MAAGEKMATGPRAHEPAEPGTGETRAHRAWVGAWLVTTSHQTSLQAGQGRGARRHTGPKTGQTAGNSESELLKEPLSQPQEIRV